MARKDKKPIHLVCTVCLENGAKKGATTYTSWIRNNAEYKLDSLMKYCAIDKKHTIHKQAKVSKG